jgi:hypothetical protein
MELSARAEAAATRAATIAVARNESHTRMLAEAQLDSARRRLALRAPAAEEPAEVAREAERLAGEFGRFFRRRSELQSAAA